MIMVPERYGQTDRRLTVASPRSALASRGKNLSNTHGIFYTDMEFGRRYSLYGNGQAYCI